MVFKDSLFGETESWRPGVYFDAEYASAHFCRVKNPLNRHIAQFWLFWQKIKFFSCFPYWSNCKAAVQAAVLQVAKLQTYRQMGARKSL